MRSLPPVVAVNNRNASTSHTNTSSSFLPFHDAPQGGYHMKVLLVLRAVGHEYL